jgi:uncharacterized protein YeaO (DUF488 family)
MDFDQWTQSISREVTAFSDNSPKVSNRFLEAYEDELNEEEEIAILGANTKMKTGNLSALQLGK